jgi:hypothetical protein
MSARIIECEQAWSHAGEEGGAKDVALEHQPQVMSQQTNSLASLETPLIVLALRTCFCNGGLGSCCIGGPRCCVDGCRCRSCSRPALLAPLALLA